MKFRVERNDLTDAVAWTARSLPAKATVQILSGILLETTDSGLSLSGFDFEVAAQATIDATVGEPGRLLVSGRLLNEISRALPAAPVDITTDGSKAVLTCGSARFTLPTMSPEDYPTLPELPPVAGRIESSVFTSAVAQVAIAAGKDDTLPMLTGIRMEIDGDRLTLAATDRYRLAIRELTWTPSTDAELAPALIPARTLSDTARAFSSAGSEVTLALGNGEQGEGMAGFELRNAAGVPIRRTTTRLIEAEFPRYRALLPDSHDAIAEVDTAALVEAVKRVSLVVASRTQPVRLSFAAGELVLDAGSGDEAQASERLDATFDGEPLTIAFNPQYLLDGLSAIESDVARLGFTSPTKPAVITGKLGDSETPEYRYLLMPVRLAG